MLHSTKIAKALEEKIQQFRDYDVGIRDEMSVYSNALDKLETLTYSEILDLVELPAGALPSREWKENRSLIYRFDQEFHNHEEARAYASQILFDRTTFSVDGSQIQPVPDISIPVAAVQVGWFENPHNPSKNYVKDIKIDILPPEDIFIDRNGVSVFSDQTVSQRRFQLEIEVLCDWMEKVEGMQPTPIAFLDGSLILSFTERLDQAQREIYLKLILHLLETSYRTKIPVVGYVSESRARDLMTLLAQIEKIKHKPHTLSDAMILYNRMRWGDRTPVWICNRHGILTDYRDKSTDTYWGDQICFFYLKTSEQNVPSRVEIPRWVVEEGMTEEVAQIVRAETIVGNGYPYVIETADALAVLSSEDRIRFYQIFESFADKNNIKLRIASKIQSKMRRRQ